MQSRRRDREAEVIGEEADDLARDLQFGDVSVQQEAGRHSPTSSANMAVQYLVDFNDLGGHAEVIAHEGRLCRPDNLGQHAAGARRGPGQDPPPR